MTEERKQEISKYIAYCIMGELKNVFINGNYKLKDIFHGALPCMRIQWWYDKNFNKIYLFYEIDSYARHNYNPIELYLRINSRLINNFYKDNKIWLNLTDPSIRIYNGKNVINVTDTSCKYLRVSAFSYWYCNGSWRFIENYNKYNHMKYMFLIDNNISKIIEFEKEVMKINKKYNFMKYNHDPKDNDFDGMYASTEDWKFKLIDGGKATSVDTIIYNIDGKSADHSDENKIENMNNVKAGFEEFTKLYYNTFGINLSPVNESEIVRFYIDAEYKI